MAQSAPRTLPGENPKIEVRLSANTDYTRFETDEFDADITYGVPRQEGLVVLPLGEETVTPLCAPHIAETITSPEDLLQYQLIQSDNKQVRWPSWFALNGTNLPSSLRGSRFDRSFLAIAAAADGLGIALELTLLAEREILSGRLVAPLAGKTKTSATSATIWCSRSRRGKAARSRSSRNGSRTNSESSSCASLERLRPGNDELDSRFIANNSFVALLSRVLRPPQ